MRVWVVEEWLGWIAGIYEIWDVTLGKVVCLKTTEWNGRWDLVDIETYVTQRRLADCKAKPYCIALGRQSEMNWYSRLYFGWVDLDLE